MRQAARQISSHTVCTACSGYDCTATFVCRVCAERKNVCKSLAGGFGAREPICSSCYNERELSPEVLAFVNRRGRTAKPRKEST